MKEFNSKPESLVPSSIYKKSNSHEIEWFLEESKVSQRDFHDLANLISKDNEILFKTYHNLFSLQQENSHNFISQLINDYTAKQREYDPASDEYKKIQFQIDVAEKFTLFVAKYGWQYGNNAVHTLEETLI
ncbi:MAG TPA: hypothetical protein VIJ75_00410 [Hanamia sp.]